MLDANTGQPTGAMTLEQGVAHLKTKLAEKGATVSDTAIVHSEHPDEAELVEGQPEQLAEAEQTEQTEETDTEAVSTDESQEAKVEPDDRPVILPDGSQITVEEARKGYLRQADFTRKTQEVAKERERVFLEHSHAMNGVKQALENLTFLVGKEPTPAEMMQLRQQDPQKYQEVKAYWDDVGKVISDGRQQITQHEAALRAANQQKAFQALNEGTFEPTWKDPKVLSGALKSITEYLEDRGLPLEAIRAVDNHAWIEIAEESRRYRELQKAKPKAVKAVHGKPKSFSPGSKTAASPQSETLRTFQEAFDRKPTIDNAFALEKARASLRRR